MEDESVDGLNYVRFGGGVLCIEVCDKDNLVSV